MAIVLLLNLLAVAPSLHKFFHADAGDTAHKCAVTMFAQGQVDSAVVEVAATATTSLVQFAPQFVFSTYTPAIENLPAGRAPPVSSSNS